LPCRRAPPFEPAPRTLRKIRNQILKTLARPEVDVAGIASRIAPFPFPRTSLREFWSRQQQGHLGITDR
jgi:hypothetical protein